MSIPADAVIVKLFAGLEASTPDRRSEYHLAPPEAPTVGALLERLGLQPGVAGLILVNGVHARDGQELDAGDEVSLFPPLGGG